MTKDAFYFSHDSNAKTDPDIVRLRMAHGWEGYGIYWAIVEMLRDEETHKMQTEYNCIAFALNVHEEKVKSIICDFDLFEVDDGLFWSASLIRRMKKRKEVSEQRKAAAKKRWENKDLNANALQKQSKCNAFAMQGKERKGKERKEKEVNTHPESVRIAGVLYDYLKAIKPDRKDVKKTSIPKWAIDIYKINRLDGRDWGKIESLIQWLFESYRPKDAFDWRDQVRSGSKVREEFDRFELLMGKKQAINNADIGKLAPVNMEGIYD